jgi:hypothetical protein
MVAQPAIANHLESVRAPVDAKQALWMGRFFVNSTRLLRIAGGVIFATAIGPRRAGTKTFSPAL